MSNDVTIAVRVQSRRTLRSPGEMVACDLPCFSGDLKAFEEAMAELEVRPWEVWNHAHPDDQAKADHWRIAHYDKAQEARRVENIRALKEDPAEDPSDRNKWLRVLTDALIAKGVDIVFCKNALEGVQPTKANRAIVVAGKEKVGTIEPARGQVGWHYEWNRWNLRARKAKNLKSQSWRAKARRYKKLDTAVKFMLQNAVASTSNEEKLVKAKARADKLHEKVRKANYKRSQITERKLGMTDLLQGTESNACDLLRKLRDDYADAVRLYDVAYDDWEAWVSNSVRPLQKAVEAEGTAT